MTSGQRRPDEDMLREEKKRCNEYFVWLSSDSEDLNKKARHSVSLELRNDQKLLYIFFGLMSLKSLFCSSNMVSSSRNCSVAWRLSVVGENVLHVLGEGIGE